MALNKGFITGNLTRDPEFKNLSNVELGTFTLAVNEYFTGADGEKKEKSYFLDCEAWGKTASRVKGAKLGKGTRVTVEYSLKQNMWNSDDGSKNIRTILNVREFEINRRAGEVGATTKVVENEPQEEAVPF